MSFLATFPLFGINMDIKDCELFTHRFMPKMYYRTLVYLLIEIIDRWNVLPVNTYLRRNLKKMFVKGHTIFFFWRIKMKNNKPPFLFLLYLHTFLECPKPSKFIFKNPTEIIWQNISVFILPKYKTKIILCNLSQTPPNFRNVHGTPTVTPSQQL